MNTTPHLERGLYTDHLQALQAACEWLSINRGRAAQYSKLVREFFAEGKRSCEHILAYNESCEIIDLYTLWEAPVNNFSGLGRKIKAVFRKGPVLREDENPDASTNKSRNEAFVYLLAGKLIRAGVKVVAVDGTVAQGVSGCTNADINLEWSGSVITIECKRPQMQDALTERVKEARQQLTDPSRKGWAGIIAIDCSAFIRPLKQLLEADSAEDAERFLADLLKKAVVPKVETHLETTILGCLLFARAPAMTRMGYSSIVSPQGNPMAYYFRPDSISTWLVLNNSDSSNPGVLPSVSQLLYQSMHVSGGTKTVLAQGDLTVQRDSGA
jgi:hypothetical protein